MKLASEHSGDLVHGLSALSLNFQATTNRPALKLASLSLALALGALLFSLLLPGSLVLLLQDIACWGFVAAFGLLTLLATVKVIEGLLDA